MGVEVHNFGCRLNIAEGEAIRLAAADAGLVTIINSCAVTNEAVQKARQAIRRTSRLRPEARIVVTGCAAQIDPARFAAMPEVSAVVGNREKRLPSSYAGAGRVGDIFAPAPLLAPVVSGRDHARAFVEVQTGCDHRCTFCIIPFGRGNSASAPAAAVIEAIRAAVGRGQQEAVLTGVDLTGFEGGLGLLVQKILKEVPDLARLRLSSLDPVEVDPLLFELLTTEPRMMPHVHLSLQAGNDMILKRMKRRHSRAQAIALVHNLKAARPAIAVGADIIAGFPTEDDAMFANSIALVAECDIVFGHIFPFSPRQGTPAARMPQVLPTVSRSRAAALRGAVSVRKTDWLASLVGTEQRVLVERDGVSGHAENFAPVSIKSAPPGSIVTIRIAATDGERLLESSQ
ncbi:MAG: mtaB [Sphingomonadales bacterium]|nr:mtaB [Sphingomonadales bacterium]